MKHVAVSKLDVNGDFVWAKAMGGTDADRGYSIALDLDGNFYTTGEFRVTVDFDPGTGVFNLTSAGNTDIFVSKLDLEGNFAWTQRIGGTGTDSGNSITLDAIGNLYTTG